VLGSNVRGVSLGFVFLVKVSAPDWRAFEIYELVVTINRDAVAAVPTIVEFL